MTDTIVKLFAVSTEVANLRRKLATLNARDVTRFHAALTKIERCASELFAQVALGAEH